MKAWVLPASVGAEKEGGQRVRVWHSLSRVTLCEIRGTSQDGEQARPGQTGR